MRNHQATAPMLGYLYQVRCALALLLSADDERTSVCIEKFDDIAFSEDGVSPSELIQLKHHINGQGNLSDTSVDLWRTLNVWLDIRTQDDVRCLILTTASAPEGSVANALKQDGRDVELLYEQLKAVAVLAKQKTNARFYENFLQTESAIVKKILSNARVIDGSPTVNDLEDSIRQSIKYAARPECYDRVLERVEGWWLKKSIAALSSAQPVFVSQREVHSLICDISARFAPDNLPIDIDEVPDSDGVAIPAEERVFCKQLRLISVGQPRMTICIGDFFRASAQRSRWVQDELLCINELERYEGRLVDEWRHQFGRMQDELDQADEQTKKNAGRKLLGTIEDKDIRIRQNCIDSFVMRGSYHILSNKLKVGWHPDYESRMREGKASQEVTQ
jgi:hypothetical protein